MTATTALPPAMFELDQPLLRPVWGSVPCHACGEPLRRFCRQEPDGSWYRWELDHTAWDHLRAHHNGRSLLFVKPWPIGAFVAIHEERPR